MTELELLAAIPAAAGRQRDRLVTALLALWDRRLRSICRRFHAPQLEQEELLAVAQAGLLEALARCEVGRGGWRTYAEQHIRKALQRFVRHSGAIVTETEHALRKGERRPAAWVDVGDLPIAGAEGALLVTEVYPLARIALERRAEQKKRGQLQLLGQRWLRRRRAAVTPRRRGYRVNSPLYTQTAWGWAAKM